METPKLGVSSILWLYFYLTKKRVVGAGRTQFVFDPLRVLAFLLNKSDKKDSTPSFEVSMYIRRAFQSSVDFIIKNATLKIDVAIRKICYVVTFSNWR